MDGSRQSSLFGDEGGVVARPAALVVKVQEHFRVIGKNYGGLSGDSQRLSKPVKKTRGRAKSQVSGGAVSLEAHVCRHCFARLVSEPAPTGGRRYSCTNCGATALGTSPAVLCSCGMTLRRHSPGTGSIDAGLRCQPNPAPTAAFPSLFVAVPVAKAVPFRKSN